MSTQTVRSGFDTWASSGYPNVSHPRESVIKIRDGIAHAFVWLRSPVPPGADVTKATLTLTVRGASTGSRTIGARRAVASWTDSRLNWNNMPNGGTPVATKTVNTLADRDQIELDVTAVVQAWASGMPNYGWRLATSTTATLQFYSFNSSYGPTLTVTWADNPSQPTDLQPAESVTALSHPHVTFTYEDLSGNTELAAVRVQINPTDSFTAPAFDSGEVATQASGLDLAETAFAGLTAGQTAYWRIRAKDGAGLWSGWSDSVSMTRKVKPSVAITNLASGLAYETTPPIIWSVTGGAQLRYQVLVDLKPDYSRHVYASPQFQSTETAFTIPAGVLHDGNDYRVRVRVWDSEDREATPGDPPYTEAWADFHLDTDATVAPVTDLVVTQDGQRPYVFVDFERDVTPDRFAILRDGRVVGTRDAEDLFVGGTSYRYKSFGARPNWAHRYEVRAIVNGRTSANNPDLYFTTKVEGLWIVDRDREIEVTLFGDDEGAWTMEDDASVYTPVGSTEVVRIVSGMRGLAGSLRGALMAGFGKPFRAMEADLFAIKERPYQAVQIYAGDASFEALIGNITISPSPKTRSGEPFKNVSFDFWQINQTEFTPDI